MRTCRRAHTGGFGTDLGWSATYRQVPRRRRPRRGGQGDDLHRGTEGGVRGFAKTSWRSPSRAAAVARYVRHRVEVDPTATTLGPFVTRAEGYARARRSSTRQAHSPGGTAFHSPQQRLRGFNTPPPSSCEWAIKARLESDREEWTAVLTAMNESCLSGERVTSNRRDRRVPRVLECVGRGAQRPLRRRAARPSRPPVVPHRREAQYRWLARSPGDHKAVVTR